MCQCVETIYTHSSYSLLHFHVFLSNKRRTGGRPNAKRAMHYEQILLYVERVKATNVQDAISENEQRSASARICVLISGCSPAMVEPGDCMCCVRGCAPGPQETPLRIRIDLGGAASPGHHA
jgi:hypothetical protein